MQRKYEVVEIPTYNGGHEYMIRYKVGGCYKYVWSEWDVNNYYKTNSFALAVQYAKELQKKWEFFNQKIVTKVVWP